MDRRELLMALVALGAAPGLVRAQDSQKVYRIGYLSAPTRNSVAQGVDQFLRALGKLGLVDGKNLVVEFRWAEGDTDRLPELAADLVRRKVDLIVAPAGSAALAASKATKTIPVVMMFPVDPVGMGMVASLRRPGGNVTGTTFAPGPEIFGKQLQLLKEAVPHASRVALLWNPVDRFPFQLKEVDAAARALNVRIDREDAHNPQEIEAAFAAMARNRADALLVGGTSTFLVHRIQIAELALKRRLPTMWNFGEQVEAGGLMSYGVNMPDFVARAAEYVHKILKGAKPGDLPIESPTKFELTINLKTAKAIGLSLPQSMLARADRMIE
jgi:putative ABC transport system substrate-binding protein